jgi:hypothetical protein
MNPGSRKEAPAGRRRRAGGEGKTKMQFWPKHPVIYEINTWVWLNELSRKYNRTINLSNVPPAEWDFLSLFPFDAVWFMGVWQRSPAGRAVANGNQGLLEEFRRVLPDFQPGDNVGSPYCVKNYAVDAHLGGPEGLAAARQELADRGLRLILDFVPNHVAPDHPWVMDHPDYFIQGSQEEARSDPASFMAMGETVFACGRDPYFPAWPDVLQLNAFAPALRRAVTSTLLDMAGQCDGVRCDMAMLLINRIFESTWGHRAGSRPTQEYWPEIIPAVKTDHPNFLFMAEAYWDLEWELQQQGFDFCYDKRLYDRLEHGPAESVRLHLCAERAYQEKLVRFTENHDEPRALSAFPARKVCAAAVTSATIPGAKLFHEGQFEGRRVRVPVFLGRRPDEPVDMELQTFYGQVVKAASLEGVRNGEWQLCERTGWPDNPSYQNLAAWSWRSDEDYLLGVVNLSDTSAQGRIRLPWVELRDRSWQMTDLFTDETLERSGEEMVDSGLYVNLPPWGFHVLTRWRPVR